MALLSDSAGRGEAVEWRWQGAAYNSRLLVRFGDGGEWTVCKSFDEDVLPTYESGKTKVCK